MCIYICVCVCVYHILMLFTLFLLRYAHYQLGNTPLALVWKDESCSQYVIDTDNKGQVPSQQQVFSYAFFFYVFIACVYVSVWSVH